MSGKLVISLDFEKYWGMRDHQSIDDYRENLDNVDEVVVRLLEFFQKYEIHATWAVVGFLFHRSQDELQEHLPKDANFYTNASLNPYSYIDQTELDPQYHFANELIEKIASIPHQEIASHTYSHYYCLAEGQTLDNFKEDLKLFNQVARLYGHEVQTIIFPRNQVNSDYIPLLEEYGIKAYRGNEEHYMYMPNKKPMSVILKRALRLLDRYINISGHNTYKIEENSRVVNVRSNRFFAPYSSKLSRLEPLRLKRIKDSMTYAAKKKEIFHLWWHPHNFGRNTDDNFENLNAI